MSEQDIDDSPLDPSAAHLQRIRERAYRLWEADGGPHGQDLEYWERARELDAMSSHPQAGLLSPDVERRADEAALEQNLGEFPDRAADQGEHRSSPMTREEMAAALKED